MELTRRQLIISLLTLPLIKEAPKFVYSKEHRTIFYGGSAGGGKTLFHMHPKQLEFMLEDATRVLWMGGHR